MIKGIIFDLDGTLANTLRDLQTAMNNTLSYLGYSDRRDEEAIRMAINNGAREFVRRSLPDAVKNVDFILSSAINQYEAEYSKCYLQKTAPYEGIEAMLMSLKAKGIKLAVLSNKQDFFVKNIVDSLFDKKLFTVIQGQEKLPLKPNPLATLSIIKTMGIKPSQCLFVGDSNVDITTAKNAKMRSVGVCWGYREREILEEAEATFLVDKPDDICQIVEDLKNEAVTRRQAKTKPSMQMASEACEFFNKKLIGTNEFSIITSKEESVTSESSSNKPKIKKIKKVSKK